MSALTVSIVIPTSDVVVLMTQDAEPSNDEWLARLIASLEDQKIAGFSRLFPQRARTLSVETV
jgi:hypothetical protein